FLGASGIIMMLVGAYRQGIFTPIIPPPEVSRTLDSCARASDQAFEALHEALMKYQEQVLKQSRLSFWFSLISATIGFAVVAWALANSTEASSQGNRLLGTASVGLVNEAVSALFFVQSYRAQKLMTEVFDRIRSDRQKEQALEVSRTIPDEKLR